MTKSLYEAPTELTENQLDTLTESQLNSLEWAKEFMKSYERKRSLLNERKHKMGIR